MYCQYIITQHVCHHNFASFGNIFLLYNLGIKIITVESGWVPNKPGEYLNILERLPGSTAKLQPAPFMEGAAVKAAKALRESVEFVTSRPGVPAETYERDWAEFGEDHCPKTDDAAEYVRQNPSKFKVPLKEFLFKETNIVNLDGLSVPPVVRKSRAEQHMFAGKPIAVVPMRQTMVHSGQSAPDRASRKKENKLGMRPKAKRGPINLAGLSTATSAKDIIGYLNDPTIVKATTVNQLKQLAIKVKNSYNLNVRINTSKQELIDSIRLPLMKILGETDDGLGESKKESKKMGEHSEL